MTEELKQGSKLGSYELVLRVGRGGMAAVWVARERAAATKDDRLVAVKVMLTELADESEFVKMFLDEVRLVRSIRHVNVVDVYDVGEDDGVMWMAMEWGIAPCRVQITLWLLISRVVLAITRRRSIRSGRTTTSTIWSGGRRSLRQRARWFRGRRLCRPARPRSG